MQGTDASASVPGRPPLPPGPFLVLGLARSGEAVATALAARGERVIGVDTGVASRPDLVAAARRLRAVGVEVQLDASDDGLAATRTLVKSPGVPQSSPLVRTARAGGATVTGELEVAWRLLPNDFIAVTGTNGKTTTTEWIGHAHRTAGVPVEVAGNVGTALSTLIGTVDPDATIVCECSSFQLEDTLAFAPQAAVLLNITPDHLDRHGSFENYREAKLRVFSNQTVDAAAVLPDDIEPTIGGRAQQIRFGRDAASALRLEGGRVIWGGAQLMAVSEISLPGAHNVQNAMAAAAVCLTRGLDPAAVTESLRTFAGVAHRLELVAQADGISYVNDSKATNVASTQVALRSYEPGVGVHLILGGQAKAQDFTPLAPLVTEHAVAVYLIGEDAAVIGDALAGTGVALHAAATLEQAVEAAASAAEPGQVVLLSPACASFDQFKDFEERGDRFREIVSDVTAGSR